MADGCGRRGAARMSRSKIMLLLKALVSLGLIALLYSRIDLHAFWARLQGLRWPPMACFFGLLFFNTVISTLKWKILLSADDTHVRFRDLLASYYVGTFFNMFLPSNIGGDAFRIVDISRRSAKPVNTVASVFADRLSGFIALSAFGVLFPVFGYGLMDRHAVLWLPVAVFAGLIGVGALFYQGTWLRALLRSGGLRRFERLGRAAGKFLDSMEAYKKRPTVMTKVMGVSFLFQFSVIVAHYSLSVALGLQVPFLMFCVFVPLIALLEAVPLSIYGIGLRDSGYVFFMTQIGRAASAAAAMSVLYLGATLVYASLGGVVFVFMRNEERRESSGT